MDEARGHVRRLRGRAGRGRRGRDPAVRLVGRRALAGATTRSSSRRTRRGSSPRSTCRRSTSAPGTRTCCARWRDAGGDVIGLDWRIELDRGWAAVGQDRGVQGNLDPALLLGPWERVEAAALDVLRARGGRPGHVFNLGHGVLPETDPDVLAGSSSSSRSGPRVHRDGAAVVLMAYGSPSGSTTCPPTTRTSAAGGRSGPSCSTTSSSATAGSGSRSEPAERDHRGDARRARARARAAGLHRHEALDAARSPRRPSARSTSGAETVVGLVLAPHYSRALDRRLPAAARGGARRPRRAPLRRELARRAGFIDLLADRVRGTDAHVVFTAHSLPARILDEGDPYEDQLLETVAPRRRARRGRATGRSRTRASRRPASRGSARTSSTTSPTCASAASSACSSARSASSPTTSRSAGTSTPRPPERAAELGLRVRADRDAERRPRVRRASSPALVRRALAVPSSA